MAVSTTAATFTNSNPIAIPGIGNSTPYPSAITVSGLTGAVSKVTVSLDQLTHTYPDDIDVLLVGPGGQKVILMSDVGGSAGLTNITIDLDDAVAASLPNNSRIAAGTYKPTNNGGGDTFPAPSPASPYAATLSDFNGSNPNGTWSLYVVDDGPDDLGSFSGWRLNVTTTVVAPTNSPPTISGLGPQSTTVGTPTAPLAFTVGDTETAAASLLVTGVAANPALVPTAGIVFGGSGSNRTVTVTPAAAQSGSTTVTLTVTDGGGATASTSFLLTVTDTNTVPGTFANPSVITIPDAGAGTPYPSVINVSGLTGTVSKVTVQLKAISHTYPDDIDILLVGPGGQKVMLMSDVGGALGLNNVTLTLDDAAAAALPDAAQITAGTYKPNNVDTTTDAFPAPAPAAPYAATLAGFNGGNPNGAWSLYVLDDGANDQGSMAGGWALTLTTTGAPSTNNTPPIINNVLDQSTTVGTPTAPIPFTVIDLESASSSLVVSAQSSNLGLVPANGFAFTGTSTNRSVTITPAAGQTGTTLITLMVTDPGGLSATDTFVLTVSGVTNNTPPIINNVLDQSTTVSTPTAPIPFTVIDLESASSSLVVSAQSSNLGLVPANGFTFTGTSTNRGVTITPAAGQTGTTLITLMVTDPGGLSATDTFVLTVSGVATSGTFANSGLITIPLIGSSTPYPSTITVGGLTGAVSKVTVKLTGFNHTYPDDVDVLLVGPGGQKILLMSDIGGALAANNLGLTFDDAAALSLPDTNGLVTGTFKPTNIGGSDTFASPAPAAPYAALLSAFNGTNPNGTWSLYVVDDENNDQGTISGGWSLTISTTLSAPTPPANDSLSSATAISGILGSVSGNTANATRQAGEPLHAGNAGGASVWYAWTAPASGSVTLDTVLSDFDTLLGVYTGNSINSLSLVANNNDIDAFNNRSRVTFPVIAGTVYRIAVDGANGVRGNLVLRWATSAAALPDLVVFGTAVNPRIVTETFSAASCPVVEGLIQSGTRRMIRFDAQTANQGTADLVFGNPVNNPLFEWAPCHAHYHFKNFIRYLVRNTSGQAVVTGLKIGSCMLDVFRWSSTAPNNPKYDCSNQGIQVGWGDLYDSSLDGQWVDITGLPDGNYTLEMQPNPIGIVQEGNYANNVTRLAILIGSTSGPPPNDAFASAQGLVGGFASVAGRNGNATKESGEPNHAGNAGGHSVWYSWTAPSSSPVTIDTVGSSYNTLLAVYTGNAVNALAPVVSNDDIATGNTQSRVSFVATAGTTYRIAVDGFNGASGNLTVTLNQSLPNDNFNICMFVGGVNGTVTGSTAGATKEPGEPNHAGNAGGHSIWYCWTAPLTGTATFDTIGSPFNTLLAAYTGDSVTNLTPIAANDDIDGVTFQSRITFQAVGMTMYHLAIDGQNGDAGNTTLHWNLTSPFAAMFAAQASAPALSYRILEMGEYQIIISGPPLQRYRVEVSDDLQTWTSAVTTLADDTGHAWFTDKSAPRFTPKDANGEAICGPAPPIEGSIVPRPARFYRAVAMAAE